MDRRIPRLLLALPLAMCALAARAALPPWLPLAGDMRVGEIAAEERYGEALMPSPGEPEQLLRGRHWSASLARTGASGDEAARAHWAHWKPVLLQAGWTVQTEEDLNPFRAVLRLSGTRDARAMVTVFGADDIRLELVDVGNDRLAMTLQPPAAAPEAIGPEGADFPYLPPPPGAVFTGGEADDRPMLVTLQGPDGENTTPVSAGSVIRFYRTPGELSNLEFALAYRDALLAAGWTIPRFSQGPNAGDALLVAHYARDGRDLWAVLHHMPGEASLQVGEPGRQLAADPLKTDCRMTLLGVFFDFDKATLKPESDAALGRARSTILANPGLALEVQGHTDAVGDDAYNQSLSDARARAVTGWFAANGVPAAQLSAHGYGETVPVADNDTDAGRALNRRVELVCRK